MSLKDKFIECLKHLSVDESCDTRLENGCLYYEGTITKTGKDEDNYTMKMQDFSIGMLGEKFVIKVGLNEILKTLNVLKLKPKEWRQLK